MADDEDFPIKDWESIEKGHIVTRKELVGVLGARPETATYRVKLVELANALSRKLWDVGKRFTAVVKNNQIEVLTDKAASAYNAGFFDRSRIRMFKAHRQLAAVDTGSFEAKERADHLRTLVVQGAVIAGMSNGRQEVQARAYRRLNPTTIG